MKKLLLLPLVFLAFNACAEVFYGPTTINSEHYYKGLTIHGPADLKNVKADNITINGPADIKDIEAQEMDINGPLQFENIKVKGLLKVNGPINASSNANINGIRVNGPVKITNATISGKSEVSGPVTFQDTNLDELIVNGGVKIKLKDSSVNNIIINKSVKDEAQKLHLKGIVTVKGNIKFESGKGIIIIDNATSSSIKGKIEGAVIQK
jgi:hypothetical protein